MCVLYVSFGFKVRPRIFGCVAMGSALLFIVRPCSSPVSLQLLRGGIWACMRCPCLCFCWVLG